MNTVKNPSDALLAFYDSLYMLVTDEKFDKTMAEVLVVTFAAMKDIISLEECTMESLRALRKETKDPNGDIDLITQISANVFADLAPQLRNPRAQEICESFRLLSGTNEKDDLYVQVRNIRLLGKDDAGAAVLTLVVDSCSVALDLLEKAGKADCEYSHFSQGKKVDKARPNPSRA